MNLPDSCPLTPKDKVLMHLDAIKDCGECSGFLHDCCCIECRVFLAMCRGMGNMKRNLTNYCVKYSDNQEEAEFLQIMNANK
jgi:hypothetical protein